MGREAAGSRWMSGCIRLASSDSDPGGTLKHRVAVLQPRVKGEAARSVATQRIRLAATCPLAGTWKLSPADVVAVNCTPR